jgi:hypothetical protein
MRSILKRLALFALLGVMVGLGLTASRPEASLAQAADPRPNILFILADDMRASDLDYMPNTHNLLTNQGVSSPKRGGDPFALVPLKSDHPHRPVHPQQP